MPRSTVRWASARPRPGLHHKWLVGIDSSPTLAALAREAGGYERVLDADAAAIPLDDGAVDLVVAFMSLHDMDDPAQAIAESARVLEPGGRLCAAIVHPLNRSDDSLAGYFEHRRVRSRSRNGLKMTFVAIDRPLEYYTRAFEHAGFRCRGATRAARGRRRGPGRRDARAGGA
jgi:SAM-dependent methyltransferase